MIESQISVIKTMTDKSNAGYKLLIEKLWMDHLKEIKIFSTNPMKCPSYNDELSVFVKQRSKVIMSLGADPSAYNYNCEFDTFWAKHLSEKMRSRWMIKDRLSQKYWKERKESATVEDVCALISKAVNEEILCKVHSFFDYSKSPPPKLEKFQGKQQIFGGAFLDKMTETGERKISELSFTEKRFKKEGPLSTLSINTMSSSRSRSPSISKNCSSSSKYFGSESNKNIYNERSSSKKNSGICSSFKPKSYSVSKSRSGSKSYIVNSTSSSVSSQTFSSSRSKTCSSVSESLSPKRRKVYSRSRSKTFSVNSDYSSPERPPKLSDSKFKTYISFSRSPNCLKTYARARSKTLGCKRSSIHGNCSKNKKKQLSMSSTSSTSSGYSKHRKSRSKRRKSHSKHRKSHSNTPSISPSASSEYSKCHSYSKSPINNRSDKKSKSKRKSRAKSLSNSRTANKSLSKANSAANSKKKFVIKPKTESKSNSTAKKSKKSVSKSKFECNAVSKSKLISKSVSKYKSKSDSKYREKSVSKSKLNDILASQIESKGNESLKQNKSATSLRQTDTSCTKVEYLASKTQACSKVENCASKPQSVENLSYCVRSDLSDKSKSIKVTDHYVNSSRLTTHTSSSICKPSVDSMKFQSVCSLTDNILNLHKKSDDKEKLQLFDKDSTNLNESIVSMNKSLSVQLTQTLNTAVTNFMDEHEAEERNLKLPGHIASNGGKINVININCTANIASHNFNSLSQRSTNTILNKDSQESNISEFIHADVETNKNLQSKLKKKFFIPLDEIAAVVTSKLDQEYFDKNVEKRNIKLAVEDNRKVCDGNVIAPKENQIENATCLFNLFHPIATSSEISELNDDLGELCDVNIGSSMLPRFFYILEELRPMEHLLGRLYPIVDSLYFSVAETVAKEESFLLTADYLLAFEFIQEKLENELHSNSLKSKLGLKNLIVQIDKILKSSSSGTIDLVSKI